MLVVFHVLAYFLTIERREPKTQNTNYTTNTMKTETKQAYFARIEKMLQIWKQIEAKQSDLRTLVNKYYKLGLDPENGADPVSSETLAEWGREWRDNNPCVKTPASYEVQNVLNQI